jgi:CheY-like chemotaxis protein
MVSSQPIPDYFDVIILDIDMPIMDGYGACILIYEHLISNIP